MQSSFSNMLMRPSAGPSPMAPSSMGKPSPSQQQQQQTVDAVLYVWGDEREESSERALNIAEQAGASPYLTIVDVRDLRFSEIPEWLEGVPTILTVQDETVFKGTAALRKLEEIGQQPHMYTKKQTERQPLGPIQQQIEGVGAMQHRSAMMMRGVGEDPTQGKQNPPPMPPSMSMQDDAKVSAADMQSEIDAILQRREQMMNQAQQQPLGNSGPLPSMPSDA